MKRRILALVLVLATLLSLTGCSGNTKEVEEAIAAIGTVTLESLDEIEAAEALYNALSAQQQGKVSNGVELLAARKEYNRLVDAVDNAVNAIQAIGEVTLSSGDAIAKARAAYEALREDNLATYVADLYPVLTDAEAAYDELCALDLYASALWLEEDGQYMEAVEIFDSIVLDYPHTEAAVLALEKARAYLLEITYEYYKDEEYETVKKALAYCETYYGINERYKELSEKLYQRLMQIRPGNGQIIKKATGTGRCKFTVIAQESDFCIKLQNVENPSKYILFYARKDKECTVSIPEGEYIVKYTYGEYWFGEEDMFGETATYYQLDSNVEAISTKIDGKTHYSSFEMKANPESRYTVTELDKDYF